MNQTIIAMTAYRNALRAERYHLRLVHFETESAIPVNYTDEQLASIRTIGYLRAMNRKGYNIYARPVGWQYVLLDDLHRDVLNDLTILQPCALLETSPANYQVWLILTNIPGHREEAKSICRELAQKFGADLASADPDHVGRLPGFTNRKQKHQLSNGLYPFVKLHRAQNRLSTFNPSGGAVHELTSKPIGPVKSSLVSKNSTSEQDFGRACCLIRKGKSDEEIYQYLLDNSPNLSERKGSRHIETYLLRTIKNAHQSI